MKRCTEIIIVEEDRTQRYLLAQISEGMGYTVQAATSAQAGLRLAYNSVVPLIFLSSTLPDEQEYCLLQQFHAAEQFRYKYSNMQVVLLAGEKLPSAYSTLLRPRDVLLRRPYTPQQVQHLLATHCVPPEAAFPRYPELTRANEQRKPWYHREEGDWRSSQLGNLAPSFDSEAFPTV